MSHISAPTSRKLFAATLPRGISLPLALTWVQGAYYLVTGVWPLFSIRTFQLVTGPKTDHLPTGREADHWLVMTVGLLVTAIAVTLLAAAWRRTASLEIAILAIGSAVGLTLIDVIYVARQVIGQIYLVDAALEIPLIVGWLFAAPGLAKYKKERA
jgi:hypothetical protein